MLPKVRRSREGQNSAVTETYDSDVTKATREDSSVEARGLGLGRTRQAKLQALVYDILPPTTTVMHYANAVC